MKAVLAPYHAIVAQSMATSFNGPVHQIIESDLVCLQINYSGAPVGTLKVQGSLDQVNWCDLPMIINGVLVTSIAIPANPSPIVIDIDGSALPFIRLVYTATSGTGTLDEYITYKRLGD